MRASLSFFKKYLIKIHIICILDQTKYPWTISPEDSHYVFVPTKYNSYWMQVYNTHTHLTFTFTIHHFQGCLPRLSLFLTSHTSFVILVLIFILTLEMTVVILAVCLCLLQNPRTHTTLHRVMVKEHPQGKQERYLPLRKGCGHNESYRNVINEP